jgi:uncharacterized protein YhaN
MADEINSQTDVTDTSATDTQVTDPGTVANAAAKSHIARFSEKVLPGLLANAMKPLLDEIAALKAPKADADDSKGKPKNDPAMAAVQAQLEDMKSKFAQAEAGRAAAEKRSRDDGARAALKDALSPHVRPELLGMLTDHLTAVKQVIEFDEEGNPLFKSKRLDIYGDPEEVRMPLKDGVSQFLKSEEAKAFLPAPGSSGAAPMKRTQNGARTNASIDLATASDDDKIRFALDRIQRAENKS